MKSALIALLVIFFLNFGPGMTAFAHVSWSVHNMVLRNAPNQQNGEVCIYCHSPHVEDITVIEDYNPLWAAGVQNSTFAPYASVTLDAEVSDPLTGPSRLCIGCHDGTMAIDVALGGTTRMIQVPRNIGGTIGGGPNPRPGDSLARDHPVGFDYVAAAAADDGIRPATTPFANGTIADYLFSSGSSENIMTCSTCHDVHAGGTAAAQRRLLHTDNDGSALCLVCHIK